MAEWTARRSATAEAILAACQPFPVVRVPRFCCNPTRCGAGCTQGTACVHAWYKCYVYVQPDRLSTGWTRDRIIEAVESEGVPCYQGSCSEVYLEKAFDGTTWRPAERLSVARELGQTSLMFLVHPTLTHEQIDKTCNVIARVLDKASAPRRIGGGAHVPRGTFAGPE
jgi:dTDP-4-amino-4,6-dideoxygalactose transaminase